MYDIKRFREKKGWTQEQLEEASGIHRILISRYETKGVGMSLSTAMKLADALGCTIDELTGRNERDGKHTVFTDAGGSGRAVRDKPETA